MATNPFKAAKGSSKTPPVDGGRATRSRGTPAPLVADWSNPKLRKLAPGGSGGKGSQDGWKLDEDPAPPFSPLAAEITAKKKARGPPAPSDLGLGVQP